jgi:hypothetical protein
MSENEFLSLTKPLSVSGTSYKLNLGLVEDKWALKVFKGNSLLDLKKFDISYKEFPDQNLIVQWILQIIVIPNINPHLIMKSLQKLTKEALENKKKLMKSEEYLQMQRKMEKLKESMKFQKQNLEEKQKFLNIILNLIDNGGSGHDILNEFENHPAHHVGILKAYKLILQKIGDSKLIDYLEKEKKKDDQFKQLNSAESFVNVLKTENQHIQQKINNIKNQLQN